MNNNNNVNPQYMQYLLNQAYQQRLSQMLDPANIYAQQVGQGLNALKQQQTQQQIEAIRNDALYGGRIPYPVQQVQQPQQQVPQLTQEQLETIRDGVLKSPYPMQQTQIPQEVQYLPRRLNEMGQIQYLPRSINSIPQAQLLNNNISQQP